MIKSIGFRINTEGRAEVVNDFAAVKNAGVGAMDAIGDAGGKAALDGARATEELTKRQLDSIEKVRAAAARQGLSTPTSFGVASAGDTARDSANVKMAAALKAELDPLWAATQRLNGELARLNEIERLGVLSAAEMTAAQSRVRTQFEETRLAIVQSEGAHRGAATGAGAQRAAMQQLSFQAQDVFTQLSMGANVFEVVAIQGGQAAGAFANVGGKAEAVARFMIGPWGLAITAGMLVIGALTKGLNENAASLDDEIDKLKKNADQSRLADEAKHRFAQTLPGLTAAIHDQIAALKLERVESASAAERANLEAKQRAEKTLAIRQTTAALLDQIRAQIAADEADTKSPDPNRQFRLQNAREMLPQYEKRSAEANAAVTAAEEALQRTRIGLAEESAKRLADPMEQIKKRYDDERVAALKAADAKVAAGGRITAALRDELAAIERNRQAAINTEEERRAALKASGTGGRQTGRSIDLSGAEAIVHGIGGRVTSGLRSHDEQRQLYAKYLAGLGPLAAKPGSSLHESGQALDIAKTAGMSLAKIRAAFAAAGVSVRELLDEGDHFHVGWGKGAASATKATDDMVRKIEALQGKFDPAGAAAREYKQALAEIDSLHLDPAKAAEYADAARVAFVKARAAAFELPEVDGRRPEVADEAKAVAARSEADERRAISMRNLLFDQAEQLGLAQQDLALAGASDDVRERETSRFQLILRLRQDGVAVGSADYNLALAYADAIDWNTSRLKVQAAAMDEVRGFGQQLADDVLNPDTWSSWGNAGKTILNDLKSEFIKLALLNPLKT